MITSLEMHIAAAVLMAFTCVALGWLARRGWEQAGRDLGELADLETVNWVDWLTEQPMPPEMPDVEDPLVRVEEAAYVADMRERTDRFIAAIRAGGE